MPKGRRKSHSKRSLIYNAYLLVIFILIKIGRIPISIVYQLWFIDYRLKKARLLKLSYSIIHIQYSSLPYIPKRNLILISALLVFFAYTLPTLLLLNFTTEMEYFYTGFTKAETEPLSTFPIYPWI